MLTILFKILSILGILLLILLGVAAVVILLVLFFPICYKVSGQKSPDKLWFTARAGWLFGLLRVSYDYPDPGKLLVKLLFFTVFDSEKSVSAKQTSEDSHSSRQTTEKTEPEQTDESRPSEADPAGEPSENSGSGLSEPPQPKKESIEKKSTRLYGLWERIRYTFQKICAKIKDILQNIAFYKELWEDPDTQGLLKHAGKRLGHIFQRLRPGKLTVTAVIGTGSPDTTGYLYGVYGILLPKLGKGVCITPDFEQAVLEGTFKASGHFTVACVLFHSLRLVLDRRLRQLISKIRHYQKTQKK